MTHAFIHSTQKIMNNGSNEFLVDLAINDAFTLEGYLTSSGHQLCNGILRVKLIIFIKDLQGNILDTINLEEEEKQVRGTAGCNGSDFITKTVKEAFSLESYGNHGSITVDVFATTQADVSGIKGSGRGYGHDISLHFGLIEREIPITNVNNQEITFNEHQNDGDFNETPITEINLNSSCSECTGTKFIDPIPEKQLTENYLKIGGIAAVGIGILLLYTRRNKK